MRIWIGTTVIVFSALLQCSLAVGEPDNVERSGREVFSVHDTNQDGVLDKYEYEKFLYLRSRRMEATDSQQRYRSPHFDFEEVDSDGDGYITEDELVVKLNRRLRKQRRIRVREGQW